MLDLLSPKIALVRIPDGVSDKICVLVIFYMSKGRSAWITVMTHYLSLKTMNIKKVIEPMNNWILVSKYNCYYS